jgi:general stress protein 26
MENLKRRIFDLAKDLQLMSLATVTEDGRPRVRYVVGKADPVLTLRFSTHLGSAKVQQMRNKPSVSVTTGATGVRAESWLEIEGGAAVSTAEADRRAFWFDGLGPYFAGVDDPNYCIVIIRPSRIALWSMATMRSDVWQPEA